MQPCLTGKGLPLGYLRANAIAVTFLTKYRPYYEIYVSYFKNVFYSERKLRISRNRKVLKEFAHLKMNNPWMMSRRMVFLYFARTQLESLRRWEFPYFPALPFKDHTWLAEMPISRTTHRNSNAYISGHLLMLTDSDWTGPCWPLLNYKRPTEFKFVPHCLFSHCPDVHKLGFHLAFGR